MIHDLSITLSEQTLPFLPAGDPHMVLTHRADHSFAPCQSTLAVMMLHFGTHVDAPRHYIPGALSTSEVNLEAYCGMAVCIDVSDEWKPGAGGIFDLRPALEKNAGLVQKGDKLLVYTGTEKLLGTQAYFDMPDFAGSTGALLEEFGITGIGMDTSTIAAMNAENQHQEILSRGMGIYESLAGLEPLIGKRFYFSAVPVKFEDGDGSPVRAYAVTE